MYRGLRCYECGALAKVKKYSESKISFWIGYPISVRPGVDYIYLRA